MQHFELEAREAIRDLAARYNQYGDAGRIDALLDLFCEDAVLEIALRIGNGRAGGENRTGSGDADTLGNRSDNGEADARSGAPGASAAKTSLRYAGKERIRALFTESRSEAGAGGRAQTLRHFIATHLVDVESEHAASGRCYYAVLGEQGIDHFGRYQDRYRRTAEGWRFAARKVYVDVARAGGYAERNLGRLFRNG